MTDTWYAGTASRRLPPTTGPGLTAIEASH